MPFHPALKHYLGSSKSWRRNESSYCLLARFPFWHKVSDRVCSSSSKLKSHEQEASSSRALNAWMRMLHSGEAWLSREEANRTNLAGRHFLDCYGRLAHICHSRSELKFGLVPKVHMLWHIIHNMIVQTRKHGFCENPLSESCSIDEDFIGKFCQLTRSVSPRLRVQRALERYLTHVQLLWQREAMATP